MEEFKDDEKKEAENKRDDQGQDAAAGGEGNQMAGLNEENKIENADRELQDEGGGEEGHDEALVLVEKPLVVANQKEHEQNEGAGEKKKGRPAGEAENGGPVNGAAHAPIIPAARIFLNRKGLSFCAQADRIQTAPAAGRNQIGPGDGRER
jgi:hypothetical protein